MVDAGFLWVIFVFPVRAAICARHKQKNIWWTKKRKKKEEILVFISLFEEMRIVNVMFSQWQLSERREWSSKQRTWVINNVFFGGGGHKSQSLCRGTPVSVGIASSGDCKRWFNCPSRVKTWLKTRYTSRTAMRSGSLWGRKGWLVQLSVHYAE